MRDPLPARRALHAVLGALTDHPAACWADAPERGGVVVTGAGVRLAAWTSHATWAFADAREAVETLDAVGLLPPAAAADASCRRRVFWCGRCKGTGEVRSDDPRAGAPIDPFRSPCADCLEPCEACDGRAMEQCLACDTLGARATGVMPWPLDVPVLVAWASLGGATVTMAEELARRRRSRGAGFV